MSEVHLYIIVTLLSDQIVIISELFFFSIEIRVKSKDVYTGMGGTTTQEYSKPSVPSLM